VDGRQGDVVSARFAAGLVALALGAGLVTAACGSSSDSSSSTSASGSTTASATATPAPARATSSGSQLTTVDLVEQLRPSVVHILSETSSFNVFGQVVPQQGVGTGIILDADGHIVTNNHVITDANGSPVDKITVTLSDNNQYQATIVGRDTPTDLAVLKITASSLTPAALGVSADLKVGQDVIAMGNALDLPGGRPSRQALSARSIA
jgi:S1-C subfamily serine protease